eukprot:403350465
MSSEQEPVDITADVGADGKQALSKAQKKKAKAKAKDVKDVPAEENGAEEEKEEKAGGAKAKKGKKGAAGGRSAIAALAQQRIKEKEELERIQREEDERIRLEEEAAEKIRLEEENIRKEQEERRRKEKRDKIEELKRQGKYLTKAQKQQKEDAERRRNALIAAGMVKPEDPIEDEEPETGKKHSTLVRNKKKKDKKKDLPTDAQTNINDTTLDTTANTTISSSVGVNGKASVNHEEAKESVQINTATNDQEEEEDVIDDWENADIDDMTNKIQQKSAKQSSLQGGKAIREDEEEDKLQQEAQQEKLQKTIQAQAKAKKQVVAEETKGGDMFDRAAESTDKRDKRLAEIRAKREERDQAKMDRLKRKKEMQQKLRCPIICILGHVDTGKTLILDKLRRTNVQAGEAGGITQQIGATYFPEIALREHQQRIKGRIDLELQIPGFQIIDTPGHESFTNLRSRGSNLCDIAILVVDIMHGLEKQTLESLQLLLNKKTPFIVALNKIDRIYEWKSEPYRNTRDSIESQAAHCQAEFKERLQKTILEFSEQGLNSALYWENPDPTEYISMVPTSAITGEGLPDLMIYISQLCQTMYRENLREKDEFECSVLEVKVIEGLGTTIDVILVNGILNVGDTIVLSGFNGPIVSNIRALLTPQPMREMRVKGDYIHHQSIQGSMGIKISANGLENAIAGSELFRATNEEEIETYKAQIQDDLVDIMDKYVDKTASGVCVQASTLGSLEALLEFLKTMKIPVTAINIGPVHKKDILKAMKSIAGEFKEREFATVLAFDVKITPEAQQFAEENEIKIFTANIIYHLFDQFTEYVKKCRDERKTDEGTKAVFPCLLEIVKGAIFNNKNPIIIGVTVKAGILKVGTPLCIPEKGNLRIGTVESIELNSKPVQTAQNKHGSVAVKIGGESQVMIGRHFDESNQIVSILTRDSIDALKQYFKDDLNKDDWKLVLQLKKMFGIP